MNDSKPAANQPQIVDPAQIEKQATRAIAQLNQSLIILCDIIDALRNRVAELEAKNTGGK
jgi:hypothetical protein